MGMPVEPVYHQAAFRARTAVPDPSGVDAAFDGSDAGQDVDWTQVVDLLIRVRIRVDQVEATAVGTNNQETEFLLQYENATQATGFLTVGAVGADVEHVQYIAATGFAEGDDTTTARLGSANLVTGDGKEVAGATDTVTFADEATSQTELEFSIEIVGANVDDGDVINLRLLHSDADESPPATILDDYPETPTMTVDKPTFDEAELAGLWTKGQQEPVRERSEMVAY